MDLLLMKSVGEVRMTLKSAIIDFNETTKGLIEQSRITVFKEFKQYFEQNGFLVSENPETILVSATFADIDINLGFVGLLGKHNIAFNIFKNNDFNYVLVVSALSDFSRIDSNWVDEGVYKQNQTLSVQTYQERINTVASRKSDVASTSWSYSIRKDNESGQILVQNNNDVGELIKAFFETP